MNNDKDVEYVFKLMNFMRSLTVLKFENSENKSYHIVI